MAGENDNPPPQEAIEPKAVPANPSRRRVLGAFGAVAGAFGLAWGAKKISQTETAQRIMKTAPGQDHSDKRPSLYTQQTELQKNLDAQDPAKRPSAQVEPTQQKLEAEIKATMDANPANRNQTPYTTKK